MSANTVSIEVTQLKKSCLPKEQLRQIVVNWLADTSQTVHAEGETIRSEKLLPNHPELAKEVESILFCTAFSLSDLDDVGLEILIYKIIEGGAVNEKLTNGDGDGSDKADETSASNHWLLPTREYHGLWESLFFEDGLKENLLKFVETSMLFARKKIDPNVISCNRLVLLHGPPGTGKTSLCKAIAQKLAIRNAGNYRFSHLIEINSHSLFSKWFSESGKLVMKLFDDIKKVLEHDQSHVCLLIDEVESIAFARQSVSENEPSDSMRVVNALLTQLDQIRHHSNLLVLTTSNMTASIDPAFMDRADIKQFVGHPSARAIRSIFQSAIGELVRTNIITNGNPVDTSHTHQQLTHIIGECIGFSGRTLRKLPFLAHALFMPSAEGTLEEFLVALRAAVRAQRESETQLTDGGVC